MHPIDNIIINKRQLNPNAPIFIPKTNVISEITSIEETTIEKVPSIKSTDDFPFLTSNVRTHTQKHRDILESSSAQTIKNKSPVYQNKGIQTDLSISYSHKIDKIRSLGCQTEDLKKNKDTQTIPHIVLQDTINHNTKILSDKDLDELILKKIRKFKTYLYNNWRKLGF